jgi:NADH-quinone oxidoreductase subunit N
MIDWISILPQLLLAGGGFIVFCVGAFWRKHSAGLLFGIALLAVCAAGLATILHQPEAPQFLRMIEVTGYGRFFTFLITLITAITLLFSHQYSKIRGFARDEFYGLILFAALGMSLVSSAVHWLTFFLGLEVLSLSLYVLIAIRKDQVVSNEAGIKYFIMGAVASAFLTFGIALIYALTGKLDIAQSLAGGAPAGSMSLILLGVSLILVGIGFKISMVPFHLWTPDVYQGAPAPVTAFLSTGSKVALFAALLRFVSCFSGEIWAYFIPVIWILAFLTMVVGNISALAQTRVKRLLAYSSVAQMGYLLMTLLALKQNGASAIMLYLTIYSLMDLGAFGTLATLSAEKEDLDVLEDYKGLGYSHPWRSAILATCLFSLAGMPPTAGFIGKFALFQAVLQARFVILAVIGILTVIVSIYFYFKVIMALFMRAAEEGIVVPGVTLSDRLAGGLILVLILWLGLVPNTLLDVIGQALPFISAPFPP